MHTLRYLAMVAILATTSPAATYDTPPVDTAAVLAGYRSVTLGLAKLPALPVTAAGVTAYWAPVKQSDLAMIWADYRRHVVKNFGRNWDPRFDCEAACMAFALELRVRLANEHYRTGSPARRPAVFMLAYIRNGTRDAHAVLFILTDCGPALYDPLRPGIVVLMPGELSSIYYYHY